MNNGRILLVKLCERVYLLIIIVISSCAAVTFLMTIFFYQREIFVRFWFLNIPQDSRCDSGVWLSIYDCGQPSQGRKARALRASRLTWPPQGRKARALHASRLTWPPHGRKARALQASRLTWPPHGRKATVQPRA